MLNMVPKKSVMLIWSAGGYSSLFQVATKMGASPVSQSSFAQPRSSGVGGRPSSFSKALLKAAEKTWDQGHQVRGIRVSYGSHIVKSYPIVVVGYPIISSYYHHIIIYYHIISSLQKFHDYSIRFFVCLYIYTYDPYVSWWYSNSFSIEYQSLQGEAPPVMSLITLSQPSYTMST